MGQVYFHNRIESRRSGVPRKSGSAVLALCAALLISACDRNDTTKNSAKIVTTYEPARHDFGDASVNFLSFIDAFGSFAIVHQFDRDTDGDGEVTARLGDHGEPEGDWPSAILTMLPDGATERYDELVTSSVDGRWVVLRRDNTLFAVSAGQRWEIGDADLRPDPSPCMSARQATIDPTSKWLVFLRDAPSRAVVKNLSSGKEREIAVEHDIWRAEAMPRGWVLLREVASGADFPRREGTCVCRWCSRFATSVGKSKLAGGTATDVMVDAKGRRFPASTTPLPVGFDLVWSISESKLTHLDGSAARLGDVGDGSLPSCALEMAPIGVHQLLLDCRGKSMLWESNTGGMTPVERPVKAVDRYAPPSSAGRVVVAYVDDDGTRRIGLLNLGTGGIEPGPKAIRWGTPHPSGWRLVADAIQTYAFDAATGTTTTLDLHGAEFSGLTARAGGAWFVIDPTKPKPLEVAREPHWVAANGCYVEPHPQNELHRGPFTWVCP